MIGVSGPGRVGADPLADLEAVELGHHDVEQHEVRGRPPERLERRLAGRRDLDLEPLALHQETQRHHDVGLVVDHQNPLRHGPLARSARSPPVRAI